MYIISFLKSLLHPRNILSSIYFLLNIAIIFAICYFLSFPFVEDTTSNHVKAGLIGIGVNFVFILISLSPIGEFFWRLSNGIYSAPPASCGQAWQKAQEAFNDVKGRASKGWTVSSKVKLYYSAENYVNAFALGHRTVILTQGMLNINDYDVFRGVIAHEFGHIAHGDSDLNLGINVCNIFISLVMSFLSIFSYIIVAIIMANSDSNDACLIVLLRWVFNVILVFIFRLWSFIGVICINATSRRKEYAADKYAKDLGYGRELASFLASLGDDRPSSGWFSLMFQSHPATPDRIRALQAA